MPKEITLTRSRCYMIISVFLFLFYCLTSILLAEISENKNVSLENLRNNSTYTHIDDQPNNINWFIQVSDLHLSKYHDKERITDFMHFSDSTLSIIKPEVVIVTGDITDAKLENRESSRQIEKEWIAYNNIIALALKRNNVVWLDTRGNHDSFDVPSLQSDKNYFRLYSKRGRGQLQSYSYKHVTKDGNIVSFVAVDACPDPGPRRPFNFFGIMKDEEVANVDNLIQEALTTSNVTISFGHYPTSILSKPRPHVLRKILSPSLVYLCGHLHTLGGLLSNMYSLQNVGNLELELADWKDHRRFRILVLDHGLLSFADVELEVWPIIIVTNPKPAIFLAEHREPIKLLPTSSHVRILVFSKIKIISVLVYIDSTKLEYASNIEGPLYAVKWNPDLYLEGLHDLTVIVKDVAGTETRSVTEFSLDGTRPSFSIFGRYMVMLDHGLIFFSLFFAIYIFSLLPLLVLRFVHLHLRLQNSVVASDCCMRLVQLWLRRFKLLSGNNRLFYSILFYYVYIITGPWFVGEILSNEFGFCFLYGLYVHGHFLPASLTYVYGSLHLLFFNIPLTFYLAKTYDSNLMGKTKRDCTRRTGVLASAIVYMLDHLPFVLIVGLQIYLSITGFYRSYGIVALIICPLRTWSVFLAIYLRYIAMKKPAIHTHLESEQSSNQ